MSGVFINNLKLEYFNRYWDLCLYVKYRLVVSFLTWFINSFNFLEFFLFSEVKMDTNDKIKTENSCFLSLSTCNEDMPENRTSSNFIPFVDVGKYENTEDSIGSRQMVDCTYTVDISKSVLTG